MVIFPPYLFKSNIKRLSLPSKVVSYPFNIPPPAPQGCLQYLSRWRWASRLPPGPPPSSLGGSWGGGWRREGRERREGTLTDGGSGNFGRWGIKTQEAARVKFGWGKAEPI